MTTNGLQYCVTILLRAAVISVALAGVSFAQDEDGEAETTIRLMDAADAKLPGAVTEQIQLPPAAAENTDAVENAARGLEQANASRERREDGLANADEARERGAEMSEEARENVENRGRADENRPEPPGRPDDAGPPND